ncbi:DUF6764 family protein [Nocardia callitridis]|uniref:Protein kinase n=1 Tax=Nocardia callitridis TaxID=648753 RepID=A0ABP9JZZ0_9NOCA
MNLIGAVLCSVAAIGASVALPATASATNAHCVTDYGGDLLVREGSTVCRAVSDHAGRARAIAIDGTAYANATGAGTNTPGGATAIGIGVNGAAAAGDGAGLPLAIGIGADSVALTAIAADPVTSPFALSIALTGSRASVRTSDNTLNCLGAAALALDPGDGTLGSGAACLATPFGSWRTP